MPSEENSKDDMGEGSFLGSTGGEQSKSPQGPKKVPVKKDEGEADAAGASKPGPKR